MELKLDDLKQILAWFVAFNRTIMELKQSFTVKTYVNDVPFNRTIMELKLGCKKK